MSHPIDDLFKKGLTDLPQDGHEEGWAKARVLLGFEKRRKNRFFLLFFLGGLLLTTVAVTAGMNYWNANEKIHESVADVTKVEMTSNSLIRLEKTPENGKENAIAKSQIENQESEIVSKELNNKLRQKNTTSSTNESLASVEAAPRVFSEDNKRQRVLHEQEYNKNSNGALAAQTKSDFIKSGDGFSFHDEPILKENTPTTSTTFTNSSSKITTAHTERASDEILTAEKPKNERLPRPIDNYILKADKLPLSLLDISRPTFIVPEMENIVVVQDTKMNFEKSGYIDYQNRFNRIGIGASGRIVWNEKWSGELSLGMNRSKNDALDNIETNTVFSPNVKADVSSVNEYAYYSLNLTLRFARHIGRSRFFGGMETERPLFLNGLQEVQVSPQMSDIALDVEPPIGAPNFGTTDPPITSIIDYNLNTVPELDRFILYGQFGYGYRISSLVDLSLSSSYQFSDHKDASPLLPQAELMSRQNKWGFGLRMDMRF